ncbi:MAG: hypothetical protein SFW09_08405 [Hyphomicrobiaceae bacterium]|nr:hypothetical protein [Hyphomicrobiaceae bacterium]
MQPRFDRTIGKIIGAVLALAALGAAEASADAIDGEWCREGRHFVIDGRNIITYGGTRMTGDYDRHGFRYTVPPPEPEAGTEIEMVLRSETTLDLFRRAQGATGNGPAETWNRCRVTS